jgi:hypothetical protein
MRDRIVHAAVRKELCRVGIGALEVGRRGAEQVLHVEAGETGAGRETECGGECR